MGLTGARVASRCRSSLGDALGTIGGALSVAGNRPARAGPEAVEWGTVRAAGADFAYLVATSGADRRASGFEEHWDALPAAGLRRGAIHLYSLCQPAERQANAFNTFVPRTADALPVAVDLAYRDDCAVRPARAAVLADIRRFAALVEAHTGAR